MPDGMTAALVTDLGPTMLSANLRPAEISRRAAILKRELKLVRPEAVACMGNSAFWMFHDYMLPTLGFTPLVFRLTHYSARGKARVLRRTWHAEFIRMQAALDARGVSTTDPLWLKLG